MAFDEGLAERLRTALQEATQRGVVAAGSVTELRMFGGLCFLHLGNMCCGVTQEDLMFRVGAERYEEALARPAARPMDFTGRPLKGLVYVAADAIDDAELDGWVELATAFTTSLPPKPRTSAARAGNR